MKQNNRFCVLALTAVLALTLTACSETADGSAASGSTQTTPPAQSTAGIGRLTAASLRIQPRQNSQGRIVIPASHRHHRRAAGLGSSFNPQNGWQILKSKQQ